MFLDEGNDIEIIQKGDAGIGITEKEKSQASLGIDYYSILEFSSLNILLLLWSRLTYFVISAVYEL